jgi:Spy/CpxP family protein refolding chaperone
MVSLAVAGDKAEGGPAARGDRHPGMGRGGMEKDGMMMSPMHIFGNKELGLSKEQLQQMKGIVTGSTNEMTVLHAKMQEVAKNQADLMSQDLPDEAAVLKGADEIAKIHAEIGRIRMKQMLAVQKILTPEQRQKMRETMKEQMEKRRAVGDRMKSRGERMGKGLDEGKPPAPAAAPEAKTE